MIAKLTRQSIKGGTILLLYILKNQDDHWFWDEPMVLKNYYWGAIQCFLTPSLLYHWPGLFPENDEFAAIGKATNG